MTDPRLLRYIGLAREVAYQVEHAHTRAARMRAIAFAMLVLDDPYVVRRLRATRGSSCLRLSFPTAAAAS